MAIKIGNYNNITKVNVGTNDVKVITDGTNVIWSKPISIVLNATYGKLTSTCTSGLLSEPHPENTSTGARTNFSNSTSGTRQAYYGDNISFSIASQGSYGYTYTLNTFKWQAYLDNTPIGNALTLLAGHTYNISNFNVDNVNFNKIVITLIYTRQVQYHWVTIYNNSTGTTLQPSYNNSTTTSVETTANVSLSTLYGQSVPSHTKIRVSGTLTLWSLPQTTDSCTLEEVSDSTSFLYAHVTSANGGSTGQVYYDFTNKQIVCSNIAESTNGNIVFQTRVVAVITRVDIWTPMV